MQVRFGVRRKAGRQRGCDSEIQVDYLAAELDMTDLELTKSAHVRRKFHCFGTLNASPEYCILKKKSSPEFRADVIETSPSYPFPILRDNAFLF
jgi:hypothetical protein